VIAQEGERCHWIGHLRRCRYSAGHDGPHSWQYRVVRHGSEAERIIAATIRRAGDDTAGGVAATEAEPRRDPQPATIQDTSLDPWNHAGETVEGDLALAVSIRAHLLAVRDMVAGSAVPLARAWEPVEGTWMPEPTARRIVFELEVLADFYRRIAARAYAAQAAVMAGDVIARRLLRQSDEGRFQ